MSRRRLLSATGQRTIERAVRLGWNPRSNCGPGDYIKTRGKRAKKGRP